MLAAEPGVPREPVGSRALGRYLPRLATFSSVLVFALAIWFLHRELARLSVGAVIAEFHATALSRALAAGLLTAGGYAVLTTYDALALRYIRKALPYARTALISFMAFAVGNNVGIASLSGGAIRYRMYSALGLSGAEIARVVLFCTVTFVLGAALSLGAALWLIPSAELSRFGIPVLASRLAGTAALALAFGYLLLPLLRRAPIRLFSLQVEMPALRITVAQALVAMTDLILTSATLYVLIQPHIDISFPAFLGVFLVAISAGLLSNVPGGIGVFEAMILLAFPDVGRGVLLGTILMYRLIYFIGPLIIALTIMAGHEMLSLRRPLRLAGGHLAGGLSAITPQLMGAAVFLSGVVLLVSGASPAIEERLRMISRLLPQPVLEISHLAGSLIGLSLLVLARGLYRRLHSAFQIVGTLLVAGAAASLLKGLDFEEAIILLLALLFLWVTRREFYRRGSMMDQRFSAAWVAVILIAIVGTAWVGFASYRHVPYSNELWWQFSLDGNAPRMLRAMLLVSVTAVVFSIMKLMRPSPPLSIHAQPGELEAVRQVVAASGAAYANAALIGDKRFLFNAQRTAFVMYRVGGRSWVALGDPVGPEEERENLAWQFFELCDRYDAWPAFYEVPEASLPIYIDMGLSLSKLGEEALVPLADFSLEGKHRADFRQARHRAERIGARFSVVPRSQIAPLIPELAAVSDAWLLHKGAAEKSFSLGRFSAEYIANFDCALVTLEDEVVAFANLWQAPAGSELSIDLMRYNADAPSGIMDFLFAELLLWAKDRDYTWFNLGMSPLSGLEQHPLAPLWHQVGNLVFRHADDFYNFAGLRRYKEKFQPVWRARYLASPGGLALPRVFLEASILISGGLTKIVAR